MLCLWIGFKPQGSRRDLISGRLQSCYVLAPANKATRNILVVWRRCSVDYIKTELGVTDSTTNNDSGTNLVVYEIIDLHKDSMESLALRLVHSHFYLLGLHWTSKLHKILVPVHARLPPKTCRILSHCVYKK
jgi:hypothetical protein